MGLTGFLTTVSIVLVVIYGYICIDKYLLKKRRTLVGVYEFGSTRLIDVTLERKMKLKSSQYTLLRSESRNYILGSDFIEVKMGDLVICRNKYYGTVVGLPGKNSEVTELYDPSIGEIVKLTDDQKKYLVEVSKDLSSRYLIDQIVIKVEEGSENRYEVSALGDVRVVTDMKVPSISSITILEKYL